MARTIEHVVREMLGDQAMRLAALTVELETLRERLKELEQGPTPQKPPGGKD